MEAGIAVTWIVKSPYGRAEFKDLGWAGFLQLLQWLGKCLLDEHGSPRSDQEAITKGKEIPPSFFGYLRGILK